MHSRTCGLPAPGILLSLVLLAGASGISPARAQVPPAGAAPGAIPPQVTRGAVPELEAPRPGVPPPRPGERPPALVAPPPPRPREPAPDAVTRFRISMVEFVGNTIFSDAELRPLARPYENRPVTLAQLRILSLRVRDLYRAHGYILARAGVPPQRIRDGRVRIAISEGRFGRIRVKGNEYYSDETILRRFSPALETGIVRKGPVERTLLLMNDLPELSVRSFFEIGKVPGTTDLVLEVEDGSPWHVGFDYDNFGIDLVGRNRAGVSVWGGHIFTEGDQAYLNATFPFPSKSSPYYRGRYTFPVGEYGTRLDVSHSTALTRVGAPLEILDIRGQARVTSVFAHHPLGRTPRNSSNLSLGYVTKEVENFVFDSFLVSNDRLREAVIGLDGTWLHDESRTIASIQVTQGLGDAFGGTSNGDPLASRPGPQAGNSFSKANASAAHLWRLTDDQFLLLRFSGQVANRPLVVPEQFDVGGPDSVRGFQQSEFLADDGYSASAEYRVTALENDDFTLQVVGFVDGGQGRIQRPLIGEVARRDLVGAGLGVRGSVGDEVSLRLDVGFPVSGEDANDEGHVVYAQVGSRF